MTKFVFDQPYAGELSLKRALAALGVVECLIANPHLMQEMTILEMMREAEAGVDEAFADAEFLVAPAGNDMGKPS